jgi:hypothetical protein
MFTSPPCIGQAERSAVQVELYGCGPISRRNASLIDQMGHPVFFALKLRFDVDFVVRWRRINLKRVIPTHSASSFTGSAIHTVDISALEQAHSETELIAAA